MNKKIPQRTCVVTREKFDKKDLIRIVRTPEQTVIIDLKGKENGRGAYIKRDIDVLNRAKKTKALDHHLEINVPDTIYDELEKIIKND